MEPDLPTNPMVKLSGDVKISANKVKGKDFLLTFLSTLCVLTDPASCELEVFIIFFKKEYGSTIVEQTNKYARCKVRTVYQGMDAIDAVTYFSDRHHTHHNICRYVNSADIKIFMAYFIIVGQVQNSRIDH